MSMAIIKIKCNKCGSEFTANVQYSHVDSTDRSEREMGEEKIYQADVETTCPNCGNQVVGSIEFWEYPSGIIDHKSDSNLDGGSVTDYGV